MIVDIELPYEVYDRCLEHCDRSLRAYEILINGVVERRPKEGRFERVIKIGCELDDAHILLKYAENGCPEAVPLIKKALR